MTAYVDPWQYPQTRCGCPNCGDVHARVYTFSVEPVPERESAKARDLRVALAHYEAIGASRALMVREPPPPVVRHRVAIVESPLRVHLLRCMTRRPRLSLLERVRGLR